MATRMELSVGGTTDVPSLADQIKRFQPRVFSNAENSSRVFDRSSKVGNAHYPISVRGLNVPRSCGVD